MSIIVFLLWGCVGGVGVVPFFEEELRKGKSKKEEEEERC
jgi:hypothetical protein